MTRITIIIDVTSEPKLKNKLQKLADKDVRTNYFKNNLSAFCRIKLKEIAEAK